MEKQKLKPEQALMAAIGFTEDDLEANREGHLSQRQFDQLNAHWIVFGCLGFAGAVLFSGLPILAIFVGKLSSVPSFIAIFILSLALGILTVIYSILRWRRYDADMSRNGVTSIEGRVHLDILENRGNGYRITIEDISFRVKKDIFLAFKNGDPYVLYYTPNTRTLLSAEWLRE